MGWVQLFHEIMHVETPYQEGLEIFRSQGFYRTSVATDIIIAPSDQSVGADLTA